jgi:hypothetical protein
MNTPRFNYERSAGPPSRLSAQKYSKWIRVSDIDGPLPRKSSGTARRKIFAIVTLSRSVDLPGKTVRHVLIFDNHPDSLRLVAEQYLNSDVGLATGPFRAADGPAAPGHIRPSHVILGLALVVTLVLAMFWPVFLR